MNILRNARRAIGAVRKIPGYKVIAKCVPLRIRKSMKRILGVDDSSSAIKDTSPFIRDGIYYANSPDEKAQEIQTTQDIHLGERLFEYHIEHPYFLQKIAPFFSLLDELAKENPGLTVIDVGCGRGITLNHVLKRYPSVAGYGFDLSPEGCLMAGKKSRGCYFQGDAEDIPLKDEIADVVLHISTLHHFFKYPDRVLEEAYRITKPGGFLLIVDPNASSKDPNIHSKVQDIKSHLEAIYQIIFDLLQERGKVATIPHEEKIVIHTERPIPPPILEQKLKAVGFSILKQGFFNYTAFDTRKHPFIFDIAFVLILYCLK